MKNELGRFLHVSGRFVLSRLMRIDLMLLAIVMTITTIGFITLFPRATVSRGALKDRFATSSWRAL